MQLHLKDPLAGSDVVVTVEGVPSLRELKLLACRELNIQVPGTGDNAQEEFLARVTVSVAGRKLGNDSDVEGVGGSVTGDPITMVCFVRPRLVQSGTFEDEDVDEDEASVETLFKLKRTIPPRIRHFLLKTCRLPEWVVAPLTHIGGRQLATFSLWVVGSKVASSYDLGPPYLLGTMFWLMFTNFSKERRREGEWSAYSIFNRGVRRLGGDNLRGDVREGWFGF